MSSEVRLKRAYAPAEPADGVRILVDRLWPRGVSKAEAAIDLWTKDLAPTTELRKWFNHDPARWKEFKRRYEAWLDRQRDELEKLRALAESGPITLVYAARDEAHNEAVVIRDALLRL